MSLADQQWCPTSVQVTVLQARGLRIKGKSGTNDAYAVMQVGKEKYQTSVVEKSVAPVWKEEAAFDLPHLGGGGGGTERTTLHVHVLHRALVGPDKQLGQAVINLLQLSEDKTRNKTEWFKLLDKTGKADKDRGEVLLDVQFMRNNMTASMFDLSAAGKSRSRLGKFKDKVRGKKKDSDSVSSLTPSVTQVMTDSEEEANGDGEVAASKDGKTKKHKMKSLFSPKSNLQKNMSQSMSVLPVKNSTLSGSQSSGLNVDSSEGKKKFKFKIHKRSGSSESKDSQKQAPVEQSNLCINGSHVYCEEPQPRTSRIGSNFSLASSGHGSMEDVPENSPPSVDSLRAVRQYSPWTEEEEEEMAEVENTKEEEEERTRIEEERRRKEEEEETVKRQQEELERLAEEKRRHEEEERRRAEEEKVKVEEEKRRREEEERVRREERERLLEEEKRRKFEEEERQREEEERIRREEEKKRQEEQERVRMEEERAQEERRRQEEQRKLAEEKKRIEEERRKIEEEERRRKEERAEEERKQKEEEELLRRREEEVEEKRRQEQERREKEEEERIKKEARRREEEERANREKEEYERLLEEKRKLEEEKKRIEAEERIRKEEEETIKREAERMRLEEQERQREEEERIRKQEQMKQEEEEERARQEMEEQERLQEEKIRREERKRVEEEERIRKEEQERIRMEEELRQKEEERRRTEEEERVRKEEEERVRKEEEERVRKEEEERVRKEEEERVRKEEEERARKEEEERIRVEEQKRQEEEEQARRERERLAEERLRLEEQEKRRKEEEERIREEEARRLEKEKLTSHAEEQERENKTRDGQRAAGKKSKVSSHAEVASTNPFDENFSCNPFEEIKSSSASGAHGTSKEAAVQQRCQSAGSSVGSKTLSTDEKDLIGSQREKRPAPQPPGRNQAELSQREQDVSTQINKQIKDKDVKTVSVLPQRSIQTIAPLSRSPTDSNTQSLTQSDATKGATSAAKHGKRPAPSRPRSVEEEPSSVDKKSHRGASDTKQVHVLNPFEDDDDEEEECTTASGKSGPAHWPPAVSTDDDDDDDKDAASQAKIKSSKVARAPLPPTKSDATSDTLSQNTEGGHVTDVTDDAGVSVPDDAANQESDPHPEPLSVVHVQENPLQESQPVKAQNTVEVSVKKEGPPTTSRRLQPVRPLNPLEQQSVSVVQEESHNKSSGLLNGTQDKAKVNNGGIKGPYSQLTQQELISLVLKQENQLSERDKKISELEQYIDNLLVRVLEEQPSILMSLSTMKKAA